MPTTIEIEGVSKEYPAHGGGPPTRAVDNVSLRIEAGEIFFLLGPSGCGKTTLLRMIAGFIDPTRGVIRFDGRDVTHVPPAKRNTGMVFQSYALWPHMTVAQNVAFGLSVRKVGRSERARRVEEALSAVRMEKFASRKPNQLSGGQQQRVALARALVIRPDVLLLDEPLSNLDAKLRHEMRHEVQRICRESSITSVYVTHDQKEALSIADRIAVMRSGQVEQSGSPTRVYNHPASRFVADFIGEANFVAATVETADGHSLWLRGDFGSFGATGDLARWKVGDRVVCCIRPESLGVATAGEGIRGTVLAATFLGEISQLDVRCGGGEAVRVTLLGAQELPKPGQSVVLTPDPSRVTVLGSSD